MMSALSTLSAERIVAAVLGLAVLLGWVRLALWQRGAGAAGAAHWRLAALAALQPLVAGALFLTLFPPAWQHAADELVVATAGTPRRAAFATRGRLVALPEAPRLDRAEAVPDLATALRRHPATRRLVVLGQGLAPRDLDSARGLPIVHTSPAEPPGIVALALPAPVAAGAAFSVAGRVAPAAGARVELVDPAGRVTDRQTVAADGTFRLSGTTRAAGTARFALRLRQPGGRLQEEADVPVLAVAAAKPRLLILAGAPGPEIKFLRRWASDAGFAVQTQIAAGGGIALGDAPIALTLSTLNGYAAAIVDERAWAGLGTGRSTLLEAVRGGMGLVLRSDGDEGTRAWWRGFGLAPAGRGGVVPVVLPEVAVDTPEALALARTRRGIGTRDVPEGSDLDDPVLPDVTRLGGKWSGVDVVPFLADAGGNPLAAWRPLGTGRVAAFAVPDSYPLALSGRADLFADWWSRLLGAVARPADGPALIAGPFWAGERAVLCGPAAAGPVVQPDGTVTTLVRDRGADGCAGFWSTRAGWHQAGTGGAAQVFYVHPAEALPALRAGRDRTATLQLARGAGAAPQGRGTDSQPGSPWPWFGLWLAGCGALWLLERSTRGRGGMRAGPVA